jgi:hypothetical protein
VSYVDIVATILTRRALPRHAACLALAASGVVAGVPLPVRAREATPARSTNAPGVRLVARIRAGEWAALTATTATLTVGDELAGPARLGALREGGFVINIRHARTDFSQDGTDLSDLANCATQRHLSAEGRAQARLLGCVGGPKLSDTTVAEGIE